jgi:hypothetical protein
MKDQIQNAIEVCKALASAIHAAKEIPSGHLYAAVMGHLTLETYNACLATLEKTGLIKVEGSHLIRWTGGEI